MMLFDDAMLSTWILYICRSTGSTYNSAKTVAHALAVMPHMRNSVSDPLVHIVTVLRRCNMEQE